MDLRFAPLGGRLEYSPELNATMLHVTLLLTHLHLALGRIQDYRATHARTFDGLWCILLISIQRLKEPAIVQIEVLIVCARFEEGELRVGVQIPRHGAVEVVAVEADLLLVALDRSVDGLAAPGLLLLCEAAEQVQRSFVVGQLRE